MEPSLSHMWRRGQGQAPFLSLGPPSPTPSPLVPWGQGAGIGRAQGAKVVTSLPRGCEGGTVSPLTVSAFV